MKYYYTYILTNKNNKVFYTGITSNLVKRIFEHKNKLVPGFSEKYKLQKLVYYEIHRDVREAILREKRIKRWRRSWKTKLIDDKNPAWEDLYPEII